MPWFIADFRLSTAGWPRVARHAFRDLLEIQWDRGVLPASETELAALCDLPLAMFQAHWRARIRAKFVRADGGFKNPRVTRDRERVITRADLLREAGRKGGLARTRSEGPQPVGLGVSSLRNRLTEPSR